MKKQILTICLFAIIGRSICWENIDSKSISPIMLPPMDRFLMLPSSTSSKPVTFGYEAVPNEDDIVRVQGQTLDLSNHGPVHTEPAEKTLKNMMQVELKRLVTPAVETHDHARNESELEGESSIEMSVSPDEPKPLMRPPLASEVAKTVTIQLKHNPWAFGPGQKKELQWKQLKPTPGFYFKAKHGRLNAKHDSGPVEVIQEVNVTNGMVTETDLRDLYVKKTSYDPIPKPDTHIYIKVVSDGNGKIEPVTVHRPEIVYTNNSVPQVPSSQIHPSRNSSLPNIGHSSRDVEEPLEDLDPIIPDLNKVNVSRQGDTFKFKSYLQNETVDYQYQNGATELPKKVEIAASVTTAVPERQNITEFTFSQPDVKYSRQIPDFAPGPAFRNNPYHPLHRDIQNEYIFNEPQFQVTTPAYYSRPDYSGYLPETGYKTPNSFTPKKPSSKPTRPELPTTTVLPETTPTEEELIPLIPTIPTTGEYVFYNNPSPNLREKMKVQVVHQHSDSVNQTYVFNDPSSRKTGALEDSSTPPSRTISVPDDPSAKHVYFNIHHEQHIKHDNGKTTLNTNPVYQVNIIPQYPSTPVHVSLKNNERVTVISSDKDGPTPRTVNVSVHRNNETRFAVENSVKEEEKEIPEKGVKKLVQLSQNVVTSEKPMETSSKTEVRSPTSVNDILRAIVKAGQIANKRSLNKQDEGEIILGKIEATTTPKPVRRFTFQTVETTGLANKSSSNPAWNSMFDKFNYLAHKTTEPGGKRVNSSDVIQSLKMLAPETVKDNGYLRNKYSSASPLPFLDTDIKNTPMPTHNKAYVEIRVGDRLKRKEADVEEMKTFPVGIPRRDWSERKQGENNKDLKRHPEKSYERSEQPDHTENINDQQDITNDPTEKSNEQTEDKENLTDTQDIDAKKIKTNEDTLKNIRYETIVENGQLDNINSHSFPNEQITRSKTMGKPQPGDFVYLRKINDNLNKRNLNTQPQFHRETITQSTNPLKVSVGRLQNNDPQLAFQPEEFEYDGKSYKIKNGYAYEDNGSNRGYENSYEVIEPQVADNPRTLLFEEPTKIVDETPTYVDDQASKGIMSKPKTLRLSNRPKQNNRQLQIEQPPVFQVNSQTEGPNQFQPNQFKPNSKPPFQNLSLRPGGNIPYNSKINHNSYRPRNQIVNGNQGEIIDNERKNKFPRPMDLPVSNQAPPPGAHVLDLNALQAAFKQYLGTTINAPGIGKLRLVFVPQQQGNHHLNHNPLGGIQIPITIPIPVTPSNQDNGDNQQAPPSDGKLHSNQQTKSQDEDYPVGERYRESNYNQQGVDQHIEPQNKEQYNKNGHQYKNGDNRNGYQNNNNPQKYSHNEGSNQYNNDNQGQDNHQYQGKDNQQNNGPDDHQNHGPDNHHNHGPDNHHNHGPDNHHNHGPGSYQNNGPDNHHNNGRDNHHNNGRDNHQNQGQDNQHNQGQDNQHNQGQDNHHNQGQDNHHNQGQDNHHNQGQDNHHNQGQDIHHNQGQDNHHNQGQDNHHNQGQDIHHNEEQDNQQNQGQGNHKYGEPDDQQYNGPNNQQYDGPNNQQYDGPNNQQYDGPNNQQYNGPNNQQYNGPNNQQYNGPNNQQYNGPNNQHYNGPNNQQYNGPNNQQYNGPNNQQYNGPNNQQYNGPNNQQYNGPNNQQYNSPNKQQYHRPNNQQLQGENPQQFQGPIHQQYEGSGPKHYQGPNSKKFQEPNPQPFHVPNIKLHSPINQQFHGPNPQQFPGKQHMNNQPHENHFHKPNPQPVPPKDFPSFFPGNSQEQYLTPHHARPNSLLKSSIKYHIPKRQYTPKFPTNNFDIPNSPFDFSFQPDQPRQNIPTPQRKPSNHIPQFHQQLPPDYDTPENTKDNHTPNKKHKHRNIYSEHKEFGTTEVYKNEEIPSIPPFPHDFIPPMPEFPVFDYEPKRLPKPTTTESPIKVEVANNSDPKKGPVTLLLYIDPKGLARLNQNNEKKR